MTLLCRFAYFERTARAARPLCARSFLRLPHQRTDTQPLALAGPAVEGADYGVAATQLSSYLGNW